MRESAFDNVSGNQSSIGNKESDAAVMGSDTLHSSNVVMGCLRKFLDRYFYFGMSLLVAAVVVFGFSHTIGANLFHPDIPRPLLLHIHAIVFRAGFSCLSSSVRWCACRKLPCTDVWASMGLCTEASCLLSA